MVLQAIPLKILEWLIGETISKGILPEMKKVVIGDEFQRLGDQALYETIRGNPEFKRILNCLREKGDFEVEDATELKKEQICSMLPAEDRDTCHEFLETLKERYIERLREIADKRPLEKFYMKKTEEHDESIAELKGRVNGIAMSATEIMPYQDIVEKALKTEYQVQLNHSWDLIENYKCMEALKFLKDLKERKWSNAEPIVKYEILRNMGAAKFSLNQEQDAAKLFLEALQYNPDDEKALCNAAFGYLILRQLEEAKTYANKAIAKNPASIRAHSIIIQASSEDENLRDIISEAEPYTSEPEVAYVISELARRRGYLVESRKWLEIAVENDKNDWPDLKGSLGERLL